MSRGAGGCRLCLCSKDPAAAIFNCGAYGRRWIREYWSTAVRTKFARATRETVNPHRVLSILSGYRFQSLTRIILGPGPHYSTLDCIVLCVEPVRIQ